MRIHIIGGPGSGKSYMGRRLSELCGIQYHELDSIVWDNHPDQYGVKASIESRDANLKRILNDDSWIVEGTYYKWLRESFALADKIFVLRPNVFLRHWRITKRFVKRKLGIEKSAYRETWNAYIKMLKWNHQFDSNNLAGALKMLEEFNGKVVVCRDSTEVFEHVFIDMHRE